jgi:hypothetical protein
MKLNFIEEKKIMEKSKMLIKKDIMSYKQKKIKTLKNLKRGLMS